MCCAFQPSTGFQGYRYLRPNLDLHPLAFGHPTAPVESAIASSVSFAPSSGHSGPWCNGGTCHAAGTEEWARAMDNPEYVWSRRARPGAHIPLIMGMSLERSRIDIIYCMCCRWVWLFREYRWVCPGPSLAAAARYHQHMHLNYLDLQKADLMIVLCCCWILHLLR